MGYKEQLGIKKNVFNEIVDSYFMNIGFYIDTMNPRFMDGYDYENLTLGAPALRYDSENDNGNITRVFMNPREVYIEKQSSWRSFENSWYWIFVEKSDTVEEIEKVLNEMSRMLE